MMGEGPYDDSFGQSRDIASGYPTESREVAEFNTQVLESVAQDYDGVNVRYPEGEDPRVEGREEQLEKFMEDVESLQDAVDRGRHGISDF